MIKVIHNNNNNIYTLDDKISHIYMTICKISIILLFFIYFISPILHYIYNLL